MQAYNYHSPFFHPSNGLSTRVTLCVKLMLSLECVLLAILNPLEMARHGRVRAMTPASSLLLSFR